MFPLLSHTRKVSSQRMYSWPGHATHQLEYLVGHAPSWAPISGRRERVPDHLPTSCEDYTQGQVWDLCHNLTWVPVGMAPRAQLDCIWVRVRTWTFIQIPMALRWSRQGWTVQRLCPSLHPLPVFPQQKELLGNFRSSNSQDFSWHFPSKNVSTYPYLSTKRSSFNVFLIICTSTKSIFLSLLCLFFFLFCFHKLSSPVPGLNVTQMDMDSNTKMPK